MRDTLVPADALVGLIIVLATLIAGREGHDRQIDGGHESQELQVTSAPGLDGAEAEQYGRYDGNGAPKVDIVDVYGLVPAFRSPLPPRNRPDSARTAPRHCPKELAVRVAKFEILSGPEWVESGCCMSAAVLV